MFTEFWGIGGVILDGLGRSENDPEGFFFFFIFIFLGNRRICSVRLKVREKVPVKFLFAKRNKE